jgi:hypothetical protein
MSHGPPSFRRAAQVQTSGCPVKIEEPLTGQAKLVLAHVA